MNKSFELQIKLESNGSVKKKINTFCCSTFKKSIEKNLIGVSNYDEKDLNVYIIDTLGYAREQNLELYELPIRHCPFCGIKFKTKLIKKTLR